MLTQLLSSRDFTRIFVFLIVGLAALVVLVANRSITRTSAASAAKQLDQVEIPGEILVRFRKGTPVSRTSELNLADGLRLQLARLDSGNEIVPGLRLARVTEGDTRSAIQLLNQRSDVVYAEPNQRLSRHVTPNDPMYPSLWNMKNTSEHGSGVAGADIKAEQAWEITKGSRNVVVAVIDEGIDVGHPDLGANIWRNPAEVAANGIDDDGNGFVDDINGYDFFHNDATVFDGPGNNPDGSQIDAHGTHVAGTIGAVGNNATGVVGVNWEVSLMSLKFIGPDGFGSVADAVRALSYARMMRDLWVSSNGTKGANIRITNNSYGGIRFSQAEYDAIEATASSGMLFVASAGNASTNNHLIPSYPASFDLPNIISVAATDRFDRLSSFSNYSWSNVHIGAPGTGIISTVPGGYQLNNGTSMASPHVAGVAALVLAQHPDFSVARLRASVIFGAAPVASLFGLVETGNRLDAARALQNANENDATAPGAISNLQVVSVVGRTVTFSWTAPGDDGFSGQTVLNEMRFIDQSTGKKYIIGTAQPNAGGALQSASVNIPYLHTDGAISLNAIDNAGNVSTATVNVHIAADAANPYEITEGPAEALSTGGTPLSPNADDSITNFNLPFVFPFYESKIGSLQASGETSTVFYSTNGTLYFGAPQSDPDSDPSFLPGWRMIAGLWDDLDLRTSKRSDAGIFVVQPDATRTIFRWQGVPCNVSLTTFQCQGGDPVNFEIELRSDGTIIKRYGAGNNNLRPVVGISAGESDPYFIASHSSSTGMSLNNAGTVTYRLRNPPKVADLRITTAVTPSIVLLGTQATIRTTLSNLGPNPAAGVRLRGSLPSSQLSFVSCTPSSGVCWTTPGVGETKINVEIGDMAANASVTVDVVFNLVTATSSARIFEVRTDWSVSSFTFDPIPSNSSAANIQGTNPNPNPLLGATAIAAGAEHGIALVGGSLVSWGQNQSAQLGDWPFNHRAVAGLVNGISNMVQADGGGGHTIVRTSDDRVWTWGANFNGQLGDGTTSSKRATPQAVAGLTGVTAVEAGQEFSLALRSNGTVAAWGRNESGQLGDGSTTNRLLPVDVSGLTNVSRISAGYTHALALKGDGTVWGWGNNERGQLGDGSQTNRTTPVQVSGLSGIVRISAGGRHNLAVDGNGKVWTWGENQTGQLGDGTTQFRTTPFQIASLSNVTGVSAGNDHSVALLNDGTVWTWGRNSDGMLGQLSGDEFKTTPGRVVWLPGVTAIAAGERFTLALRESGKIAGWGNNNWSQLGNGEFAGSSIIFPYDVNAIPPAPPPATVQFTQTTFNANENSSSVMVRLERTGDNTTTVSVDFATIDTAGASPCSTVNGQASSRCDYMKTIGTMTFEPGAVSRFVEVPIVNDIYTEGSETFTITLANVNGGQLGANSSATLTITDFGPEGTTNPIDQASFFVKQHYFDFLNRPSDSSGESFWINEITSCGSDQACIGVKRVNVSAAFFLSIEFRQTGFFAYRMYKASFGNLPNSPVPLLLNDFVRDTRVIGGGVQVGVGNWQQQLETNKVAFTQAFVQRAGFVVAYPSSMTAEQFVDKLNTNANGVLSASERSNLVAVLGSTPADIVKRAQVVRAVTEDTDLANAESNRAFVLMQYFGYLRRNPNDLPDGNFDGYNFWLDKLNQFNGNFVEAEMVKAFLVSAEYRHRFGP